MVQFKLIGVNDPFPTGYRISSRQDVESNKQDMMEAMPGWEIANLNNGSVQGASYGGKVSSDIRNDVTQKLVIYDQYTLSEPRTFRLFNINDTLPPGFRLATVQDVQAYPEALRAAMPGWEIANLANGSVEGASYGGNVRNETRNDVGQKLATRDHSSHGPLEFQLFNVRDPLPPAYRLATRSQVESHQQELFQAMPGWEIANLADGSVEGASYGGRTRATTRNDVADQLGIKVMLS